MKIEHTVLFYHLTKVQIGIMKLLNNLYNMMEKLFKIILKKNNLKMNIIH